MSKDDGSLNDHDLILFWERSAKKSAAEADYYKAELEKAHTIIGRITHQYSERWDSIRLTKHFPTDNLFNRRNIENPKGEQ